MLGALDPARNEQLLISVVGVAGAAIVDLLNFEQDFAARETTQYVRVKKEGRGVQAANMNQIAIDSAETLRSILMLSEYLRAEHSQRAGEPLEAEVYQLAVGCTSAERDLIESVSRKATFVRLCGEAAGLHALGTCLREIVEGCAKVSSRNSALTFFLEDCLSASAEIAVVSEVSADLDFKAQLNLLGFGGCFGKPVAMRKVRRPRLRTTSATRPCWPGCGSTATS